MRNIISKNESADQDTNHSENCYIYTQQFGKIPGNEINHDPVST